MGGGHRGVWWPAYHRAVQEEAEVGERRRLAEFVMLRRLPALHLPLIPGSTRDIVLVPLLHRAYSVFPAPLTILHTLCPHQSHLRVTPYPPLQIHLHAFMSAHGLLLSVMDSCHDTLFYGP